MAAKYARAGGGNWSADATWSTTSGGAADTTAPTAADDVFLNASSGNVTIDTLTCLCRSINCTGYTGTLQHNTTTLLSIGDATAGASNIALKFVAGMTYTPTGSTSPAIAFVSTSATVQTIDFAGKTTANVTFNATSNGSWQYTGQHVTGTTTTVTLTKGTLDINGQTCSWGLFNSDNSNTRALTLGAASITCTGGGNAWTINTATGMTLSANNAGCTITLSGAAANFLAGNGFTYNDVVFTGSGALYFSGTTNFRNVTRTGTAAKTDTFSIGGAPTISGTFTCNGNSSINRVQVLSSTVGTARTITAATVTVSNTDFQDITGAGAGSWDFSARTDIGDAGGNSGITFPASVAQYYGGVNLNGSYLRCNGIASNYVSAPDSAALSITGDLTIDVKVAMDDWSPSAQQALVAKYTAAGGGQRAYQLLLNTDGTLAFNSSVSGASATVAVSSTAGTGFGDGTTNWIRVTFDVDNGAGGNDVKFYTSSDGSSWSQLGTTKTQVGTTSIFDSTAVLEVGSNASGSNGATGKFYNVRIYSDITQTIKVFDADFTAQTAGTKSFTESSVDAATVSLVVTGGNWSASSWTTRVPLPQDDVYLGNAFAASQTVTADMPRLGRSIDWTGATGSPTWNISTTCAIYGSITLSSGMNSSIGAGNQIDIRGRGNFTITSNGVSFNATILKQVAPTGTYTLNDAFLSASYWEVDNGTWNSNGFNCTARQFAFNVGTATRTIITGSSSWIMTTTTANEGWQGASAATGATFTGNSSTISFSQTSTSTRVFNGGSQTYGTLTYTVAGSTGKLTITGSNSFAAINFSDASNARTLEFTAGTTTTIRNNFNVNGTSGKLMTVTSATGATHTLSMSSGIVNCDYLNISYSIAQGGAKWYAGNDSTNSGNNTGWIFTSAPVFSSGNAISSKGLINLQNIQNL